MGLPMVKNLSKITPVVAFDSNPSTSYEALQCCPNIEVASSLAQVRNECHDVIFTMLPGCHALNEVMEDMMTIQTVRGANSSNKQSVVYVDCSTVSPSTSRRWHNQVPFFVDAPVSGGVKGASEATLTFMVGSDHNEAVEKARPYLESMGKRIIECGHGGAGAATKLCNNLALAAQMVGICEAMNLGEALGVDPTVLSDALNTSTAKCWSSESNNPHPSVGKEKLLSIPSTRNYNGGFASRLMLKDLGLAVEVASEHKVALPLTNQTKELYRLLELHGFGQKDFGVMMQFLKGTGANTGETRSS